MTPAVRSFRVALILLVLVVVLISASPSNVAVRSGIPAGPTGPPTPSSPVACPTRSPEVAGSIAGCGLAPRPASAASAGPSTHLAWSEIYSLLPTNESGAGLATDSNRSEAVQFGGSTPDGLSNSTQIYNETSDSWTNAPFPNSGSSFSTPSARTEFGFAGDGPGGIAVLFGGDVGGTYVLDTNDTWLFDFPVEGWLNITQAIAPAPRQDPAFAIDPAAGIALLYGGWDPDYEGSGQVTFSDTWELNLTTYVWSRVAVDRSPAPPALHGAGLDWDPISGTFDLFGGCYPCSNTVWQFNLTDSVWAPVPTPSGTPPTGRMESVWVYDPDLDGDLLFGGTDGTGAFGDVNLFLPGQNAWLAESPTGVPAPRSDASADWLNVPGNSTLLMTGGIDVNVTFAGTWRLGLAGSVTVDVENASSSLPITDALVASNLAATAETNTEGSVLLPDLPSAELQLSVTAPGYALGYASEWVPEGGSSILTVALDSVPPATVDTLVTDAAGHPLVGALVNLTIEGQPVGPSSVAGASGWSNRTGVPAFLGEVTAWFPDYHANTTRVEFFAGGTTIVNLVLIPLLQLNVFVDGALPNGTFAPLLNASVTVNSAFVGNTDARGYVYDNTSFLGSQLVTATAPYFTGNSSTVVLPETGQLDVTLQLGSAPTGYLDLVALDAQTLLPVPSALINFTETPPLPVGPVHFAHVANAGTLLLDLLGGNYSLTAWSAGYEQNNDLPVQWIQPGQIDALTVLLTPVPRATVDTLILDNVTHRPIPGADVTIEGVTNGTTDGGGWANFTGLRAATYPILASADGYNSNLTLVVLSAGEVILRFPINLTRAASPAGPHGQNDLSLLSPNGGSIWALLLLPLGALALAVIYLTMLRAPEAAPTAPESPPSGDPPSGPPARRLRRVLGRLPRGPDRDPPR
jgi:hypothetical protein